MERALPVIVLADLAHSHQRFEVLVGLVGVDVVEGAAVSGIPIGCCEVYRHLRQTHTHRYNHTHTHGRTHTAWVGTARTMTCSCTHWKDCMWQSSLWTEFGSLPWCNPGRNTFWWSVRERRRRNWRSDMTQKKQNKKENTWGRWMWQRSMQCWRSTLFGAKLDCGYSANQ